MSATWAFWAGAAAAAIVFVATGATTVQFDATASGAREVALVGRADQGALRDLLSAAAPPLGRVRIVKHNWGLFATYGEQITVLPAALAGPAGGALAVQVRLQLPGTIVATNATRRGGAMLVWTPLPADGQLWARSRAVEWPAALFVALFAAATYVLARTRR